jgi:hypothetical protein
MGVEIERTLFATVGGSIGIFGWIIDSMCEFMRAVHARWEMGCEVRGVGACPSILVHSLAKIYFGKALYVTSYLEIWIHTPGFGTSSFCAFFWDSALLDSIFPVAPKGPKAKPELPKPE